MDQVATPRTTYDEPARVVVNAAYDVPERTVECPCGHHSLVYPWHGNVTTVACRRCGVDWRVGVVAHELPGRPR